MVESIHRRLHCCRHFMSLVLFIRSALRHILKRRKVGGRVGHKMTELIRDRAWMGVGPPMEAPHPAFTAHTYKASKRDIKSEP